MQKQQPEDVVHVGRDGWLFLATGSNHVLDLYANPSAFTAEMALEWRDLLLTRQERFASMGAEYLHLPAPEKLTVMHRYFDGEIENIQGSPIHQMASRYGKELDFFVNPLPYFDRQIDNVSVYWKTDTHWSFWGCYSAYQLLCARLGVEANRDLVSYPFQEGNVLFDLGAKLGEPVREKGRFYQLSRNSVRRYANPLVRYKEESGKLNEASLHVGSHVIFDNDSPDAIDKTVVLFGDSFSEYRPHLLTGMLAETFREVHFIWNACMDYEYVAMAGADIVISELAERFMTRLPEDNLDIHAFAKDRLAKHTSSGIRAWITGSAA